MTRQNIIAAVALTLLAAALTAAVYALGSAVCNPRAAVQWAVPAEAGAVTALILVGLAAVLFVGRAGLLLAADAVEAHRRNRAVREARARLEAQLGHGHHRGTAQRPSRREDAEWAAFADVRSAP